MLSVEANPSNVPSGENLMSLIHSRESRPCVCARVCKRVRLVDESKDGGEDERHSEDVLTLTRRMTRGVVRMNRRVVTSVVGMHLVYDSECFGVEDNECAVLFCSSSARPSAQPQRHHLAIFRPANAPGDGGWVSE